MGRNYPKAKRPPPLPPIWGMDKPSLAFKYKQCLIAEIIYVMAAIGKYALLLS